MHGGRDRIGIRTCAAWVAAGALCATAFADDETGTRDPGAPVKKDAKSFLIAAVNAFPENAVIDGDTIRVPYGERTKSVRIRSIDTEEVFREDEDRAAAEKDFDAYARSKRGDEPRPTKYGTPAGEAAKAFGVELLAKAVSARLERDCPNERDLDTYGRLLAHVILVTKDGELNWSAEMIRNGHSPYFVKYGRSRRFDALFREAEQEAMTAKRGIWNEAAAGHYPDYAERLKWWRSRADQVDRWRKIADEPQNVTLAVPDTAKKLRARVGKEAVVMGLFHSKLRTKDGSRTILFLMDRNRRNFPLVIFSDDVLKALDMAAIESRFVTVRGKVTLYRDNPQMVIERADQISTQ